VAERGRLKWCRITRVTEPDQQTRQVQQHSRGQASGFEEVVAGPFQRRAALLSAYATCASASGASATEPPRPLCFASCRDAIAARKRGGQSPVRGHEGAIFDDAGLS